jgi:predicted DNA binding protein
MATIAEFTIPSNAFPLGTIFEDYPNVHVELERVVPTNSALIPYFWVRDLGEDEEEGVERAFENHPDVIDIRRIDAVDGDYLNRVEWRPNYDGIMEAIVASDVTLVTGTGTATEWTFEVRADERGDIAAFQEHCREHDLPVTLTSVHPLGETAQGVAGNLTEAQREALVLAYEQGYFQTPRETSLADLAEELDITGQSFGSRLRRGTHRLVGSTLVGHGE